MIVLMQFGAGEEQVQGVCEAIRQSGLEPLVMPGEHVAVGIPAAIPPDVREELFAVLQSLPGVSRVQHVSRPYKLASLEWAREPTHVKIRGVDIGPGHFTIMA